MAVEIRVGGVWAKSIGYTGPATWSTRWQPGQGGGCWEASWEMDLPPNFAHPALRPAAFNLVELFWGAMRVWVGTVAEVERGDGDGQPWRIIARGVSRMAHRFIAFDGDQPTALLDPAINRAIGLGLPWSYPDPPTWDTVTADDETVRVNRLDTLINATAEAAGATWGVFADGIFVYGDPYEAPAGARRFSATPHATISAVADEDYRTHVYARYVDGEFGDPPIPVSWDVEVAALDVAPFGRYEDYIDITDRGLMLGVNAQHVAAGVLSQTGPRMAFTAPLQGSTLNLTSLGGVPLDREGLPLIQARDALTAYGLLDSLGNPAFGASTTITLGEVTYTDGEDTITLAPVGMVPRDVSGVLEEASRDRNAEEFKG